MRAAWRVGSVSYLNAKPLIEGLEHDPSIALRLEVPSRLLDGLQSREMDVALLPVIDYQRGEDFRIIPTGGIGSDGPTLTVRIFSRTPIEKIASLAVDPDSHTSVALSRILLAEQYGIRPALRELRQEADATLLIGDKVITAGPAGRDYQLDLGEAWKKFCGLPFVFAVWTARAGVETGDLPARLLAAKDRGRLKIAEIVERHALPRGWPQDLATQYLTRNLQFDIGPRELQAIRLFHELAWKHDLIGRPRELSIVE